MKTPPKVSALEEVRDEAAETAKQWLVLAYKRLIADMDGPDDVACAFEIAFVDGYLTGNSRALSHLAEQAGEFDRENAKAHSSGNPTFTHGAEWQFEQDRARVALAEERSWHAVNERTAVFKRNEDLQARLSTAERERDELKTEADNRCEEFAEALGEIGIDVSNCYDFSDLVGRIASLVHEVELEKLQAKLAAAEARCKELEAQLSKAAKYEPKNKSWMDDYE